MTAQDSLLPLISSPRAKCAASVSVQVVWVTVYLCIGRMNCKKTAYTNHKFTTIQHCVTVPLTPMVLDPILKITYRPLAPCHLPYFRTPLLSSASRLSCSRFCLTSCIMSSAFCVLGLWLSWFCLFFSLCLSCITSGAMTRPARRVLPMASCQMVCSLPPRCFTWYHGKAL